MSITVNRTGLSPCWVTSVERDEHTHDGDASITELLQPAQMRALKIRYNDYIYVDVVTRIWALFGKAVHEILKQHSDPANTIVEQRFYVTVDGWKIGLQPDRLEKLSEAESMMYWKQGYPTGQPLWRLKDFKVTRAWAVKSALEHGKREWIQQVNLYRWGLKQNGIICVEQEIEACIRDWDWKEVASWKQDIDPFYPKAEVVRIPIEMWTDDQCKAFIEERVALHKSVADTPDALLPPCSVEDRWGTPDSYVVRKKGADRMLPKSACSNMADAQAILAARKDKDECEVHFRRGESNRCEKYCDACPFCYQHKMEIKPPF